MKNQPSRLFLASALLFLLAAPLLAVDPVNTSHGVAIDGYDVVAYHTTGKPTMGKRGLQQEWNGATWFFASAENRDLFAADPEKYAPQYGGYCAYAVSLGKTAGIDPKAFKVEGGKLYLNYSKKIQKKWEEDVEGNIAKAEEKWPKILED